MARARSFRIESSSTALFSLRFSSCWESPAVPGASWGAMGMNVKWEEKVIQKYGNRGSKSKAGTGTAGGRRGEE